MYIYFYTHTHTHTYIYIYIYTYTLAQNVSVRTDNCFGCNDVRLTFLSLSLSLPLPQVYMCECKAPNAHVHEHMYSSDVTTKPWITLGRVTQLAWGVTPIHHDIRP